MNFQFDHEARSLSVEIPQTFLPYTEAAVLRLNALYPDFTLFFDGNKIVVDDIDEQSVSGFRGVISQQIYREKIFIETLPMRKSLLSAVIR